LSHQAKLHATDFSQWLVTNFPERRIHSAKIRRARLLPCRKSGRSLTLQKVMKP